LDENIAADSIGKTSSWATRDKRNPQEDILGMAEIDWEKTAGP